MVYVHHPCTWSPGEGKEEDVDADENDKTIIRSLGRAVAGPDNGDNKFADCHGYCSIDQKWSSSKLLDGIEGERRAGGVDDGSDHRDKERVLYVDLLEKGGVLNVC